MVSLLVSLATEHKTHQPPPHHWNTPAQSLTHLHLSPDATLATPRRSHARPLPPTTTLDSANLEGVEGQN
ncbi:hypothetical protein QL285_048741 [Trifolium repens]|nr:hypothetical protein QL285_048741 [Trifolium repens]